MKKVLFLSTVLFLPAVMNAQAQRARDYLNSNNDTSWLDISGSKQRAKIVNGDMRMLSEAGRYDLYALYKNKEIEGYYAIDAKGTKIPAILTRRRGGCVYCISLPEPDGSRKTVCWWTNPCQPSPKKPPIKSAN